MPKPPSDPKRQRIMDLIAADVPMRKIEDIMRMSRARLLRDYGELFGEDTPGPSRQALDAIWEPSVDELRQIEEMAGMGITPKEIGTVLGVPKAIIESKCSGIIARAQTVMNMKVGSNLFRMATGDPKEKNTVTAAIWWSKVRMNWQETQKIETSGPNGGPQQVQVQIILPSNGRDDDIPTIDGEAESETEEVGDGDLMLEGAEEIQENAEN